jgi:anti-sigma regulatory factor (Ser/Thr protein kinase)
MASMTATRRQAMQPRPDQPQPALASWPLHAALDLGALPTAPGCGRAWTRQILWEWGLTALSDSTEILVSELATNAIRASRTATEVTPVRLWLLSDTIRVVILVWDASPESPVRMNSGDDAENGRGLLLVEAISEQWGWYFPDEHVRTNAPDQHGKVVWAVVQLTTRTAARQGGQQWRH